MEEDYGGDFYSRLRGGDDVLYWWKRPVAAISIHVPREGDDGNSWTTILMPRKISIHVPREGDDL